MAFSPKRGVIDKANNLIEEASESSTKKVKAEIREARQWRDTLRNEVRPKLERIISSDVATKFKKRARSLSEDVKDEISRASSFINSKSGEGSLPIDPIDVGDGDNGDERPDGPGDEIGLL